MSMSVCNAVSRTQFTQNTCHARYGARLGRSARLVGRSPRQEFPLRQLALGVVTSTVARRIEAFERALGRRLVLSGNRGTAIDADAPSLIGSNCPYSVSVGTHLDSEGMFPWQGCRTAGRHQVQVRPTLGCNVTLAAVEVEAELVASPLLTAVTEYEPMAKVLVVYTAIPVLFKVIDPT